MDNRNNKNHEHDSLEQFFRKKAGEYDISWREEDWQKLEKQLEVRSVENRYRKKMAWMAAATFLIISLLGFFTYDSHNRINELGDQISAWLPPTGQLPAGNGFSDHEIAPSEGDPGTGAEGSADPSETEGGQFANEAGDSGTPPSGAEDPFSSPPVPGLDRAGDDPISEAPGSGRDSGEFSIERYDEPGMTRKELPELKDFYTGPLPPDINTVHLTQADGLQESLVYDDLASGELPSGELSPERDRHPSRLSAGLVMSPDLSTVGSISNFYDPGYKIGLTGEYQFSSRFAVSVGFIQSKVRYKAYSSDHNPSVYWSDGILPDETVGVCLILDIPVTLKYNFWNGSRSRFFATAGVSSYIMLNEDYQFIYEQNDPELTQSWSGRTGSRHLMSNAGFSVGYELDVHRNWSLRAEPFIRVPMQEVGWGNVRLYSLGSFISFNYKF